MKSPDKTHVRNATTTMLARLFVVLAITCAFYSQALAQTAGGTQIQNTASATYGDGSGGSYSATSNTVTVTVSNVSGLTITPDVTNGSSDPTVVPGQNNVRFTFTVTNTGNFTDNVRFKASGASVQIASGSATVASAFIDVNGNGTYEAGTDIDIKGNAADVVSPNVAQNASLSVVVFVNINAGAAAGSIIDVRLGDTAAGTNFDNQAADLSANEVRTESAASVNGKREARGDRSATVDNDAQLALSLTAPAGPVALGSNITYVWQLCDTGLRAATAVTLTNAPAGSNTGVFIFAPVPAGTALAAQAFPAGTLFSTSPVASNPVTVATWTTAQPANPTQVAYNVGASLAASACSANINMIVTITTTDATNPITNQGTAYALNSISTQISATSPLRTTTLIISGSVLNGPQGQPGAVNNTNNDDFTNKSVSTGLAGVAPGGVTTAAGTVTFTNTVQNTGNANDIYTLTVPTFPAGSTVKVTVGGVQTTVINNGVATGNAVSPLSINFGSTANYTVDITLPAGKTVLTGYDTVIRATSGNTNTQSNDTIDRVYTGFIQLTKTATVANATGVGAATDPVPGAVITYSITYQNVSSTPAAGGSGNVSLTATNIVITENGSSGTNNWGANTIHVVGATDSLGGTITGDALLSTSLTDTVASLAAQQSGVFAFKRQIK
ncbi:MAG: hypothetical protein QOC96_3438 [Acidobacteriota bacterium]|jgi:hypothetical protein|nr:hypothetical protein [Acidobacteriota bacterium]